MSYFQISSVTLKMPLECIKHYFDDRLTKNFVGISLIFLTIYLVRKKIKKYKYNKKMDKKRKEVNDRKVSLFQKLEGMISPFENIKRYCHLSGSELLVKINSGEVAPVDILEAYQANALINSNELNFIADVVYDADVSALLISRDGKQSLMGWPLSVKDTFSIDKYDSTQGLPTKVLQPCTNTSVVIRALKEEGAIPFIITNVCQGLQKMESSNPIFGRTVNPLNPSMTCGGCSGGEGASLGSASSLIGIGNDIGGSIRISASYCGIYGLKPSSSRVSSRHTNRTCLCDLIVKNSIGPMARHIDDLILTFKAMTSNRIFEMDAYTPPIIFNESLLQSKDCMKIGFYTHIGGHHAHSIPAVERAVMIAKRALEAAGHQVIEISLPKIDKIFEVISKAFVIDASEILLKHGLKDGPIDPSIQANIRLLKTPKYIRYILSSFCSLFSKSLSQSIWVTSGSTVFETWKLNDYVQNYREEVLSMLEKENIEGIICPVLPIVAPPLNTYTKISEVDIYCSVYNILDYPAGSVPVTIVCEDDIIKLNTLYPKNTSINKKIFKLQGESLGMPVGVQCVARPWRDETCLRMMKDICLNL